MNETNSIRHVLVVSPVQSGGYLLGDYGRIGLLDPDQDSQ